MSLAQALSTALSGLNATQTGLSLVAGNVANAQTPGYVRKTATLVESGAATAGSAVQVASINRVLDQFVQTQLRTESAGAGYADLRSQIYDQLQTIYGTPGSTSSLEGAFNAFTSSLQALTTNPGDPPTQTSVVSAAQVLTQQLNSMTTGIQALRGQAEAGIANDVSTANDLLQQIAQLNQRIGGSGQQDSATASLLDQRDSAIDQLSSLMDIRVIQGDHNQVNVLTTSGVQLVGAQAATLSFNAQGTVTPETQWNADPTKSTLGTITLTAPNGGTTDLVANNAIRSGEIAGYLYMRDQALVQAQAQLDQFAASMASALSDQTTPGTAATVGAQSGFDADIGSLSAGNSINLTYTDNSTGTQHAITFVRVDDPSVLPLANTDTSNPNDTVVGIDFSGGMASVVSQINAALSGTGVSASNPSGNTLRLLDDGAANTADVDAVSTTSTATAMTGSVAFPFFLDGSSVYTGAIGPNGPQSVGLAGRIAVNQSLVNDPSQLVGYQAGVANSDGTRPNFIYDQIVNANHIYSPSSGLGTAAAPFSGTTGTFLQQIISQQGQAASNASNLKQGQDVVLSALQQRFNATSSVNIDQEMSNLLNLQNAYAANAHVMSTVQAMLTTLMQMM